VIRSESELGQYWLWLRERELQSTVADRIAE
jgi:hypothetical protein